MAVLLSAADGNLTAVATTWTAIEAGAVASQTTRSANTNTTTSYVYSSAITDTNLNVMDGILLYGNRLNTTGTVTVAYSQDNGTTDTRNLTVNASDLPASPSWIFFKFASTLTLDGGADNKIGIKASSAANATFYRDGTAGNWTRRVRIVSLQSAAVGDVLYIVGEHTGAGATTTRTITMDSTATTDYGTGTDGAADNGIEIGDTGILNYGATAATNYYLKLSGTLNVWGTGTLNIGTTGTAIPRNSTAVLEFDPVADGGMGLIANPGATVSIQGLSRTSGKNIVSCKLNTDEAVNSTSLGVDTDTGWLDNDVIAVASTTRTNTETEKGAMNGNANAADLTVDGFAGAGGGLANAHSGTSPTQGEIILLTRNVQVRSATSTLMAYVFCNTTSAVDVDWAEFYYVGNNASNKHGIEIATTTGTCTFNFCSVHDCEVSGFYLTSATTATIDTTVFYNTNSTNTASNAAIFISSLNSSPTVSITNNLILANAGTGNNGAFIIGSNNEATITGTTCAGNAGPGFFWSVADPVITITKFVSNVSHSNNSVGFSASSASSALSFIGIDSCVAWRNNGNGFNFNSTTTTRLRMDSCTAFGNNTTGVFLGAKWVYFKSPSFYGGTTLVQSTGVSVQNSPYVVYITNGTLGSPSAHSTNDLDWGSSAATSTTRVYAFNTTFASGTEIRTTGMYHSAAFYSNDHDASTTTFKNVYLYGTVLSDTTTRHTASGYSWKLTPNNASQKLRFPGPTEFDSFKVAVAANSLVTITAYFQKDASYNGNASRLVLVGGILAGIASDVTASMTVASGNWELLTVTGTPTEAGVLEFYMDSDGTAGNIYIDDIAITQ